MTLSKSEIWKHYLKLRFKLTSKNIIRSYFKEIEVYKLKIGSSTNVLTGWLNSDIVPSRQIMYLDATKKFPFIDEQFHYIYIEHKIEHVNFYQARFMLPEVYRVLK